MPRASPWKRSPRPSPKLTQESDEWMNMTVIVGVDSSQASKAALRLAAQEARWRQAPLVAVSAYELPLGPVGGFPGAAMHTKGEEQATAEAGLGATVDHELV